MRLKHDLEDPTASPRPTKRESKSPESSGIVTPASSTSSSSDSLPAGPYFSAEQGSTFTPVEDDAAHSDNTSVLNVDGNMDLDAFMADVARHSNDTATQEEGASHPTLDLTIDPQLLSTAQLPHHQPAASYTATNTQSQAMVDNMMTVERPQVDEQQRELDDHLEFDAAHGERVTKQAAGQIAADTEVASPTNPQHQTLQATITPFQPTVYNLSHLPHSVPANQEHWNSFFHSSTVVVTTWTNNGGVTGSWFNSQESRFPSCGRINLSPRERQGVDEALDRIDRTLPGDEVARFGNLRFDVGTAFRTLFMVHIEFLREGEESETQAGTFVPTQEEGTFVHIFVVRTEKHSKMQWMVKQVTKWLNEKLAGWRWPEGLNLAEVEVVAGLFVVRPGAVWRD